MHVVRKVTRITQTPYAWPRLVVCNDVSYKYQDEDERVPYVGINCGHNDGTNEKEPIREWNVDLAMIKLRNMDNFYLRKV